VREAVETLVESGELDDGTRTAWLDKKRAMDLKRAQELLDAGWVLDAAKLGLPEAQGATTTSGTPAHHAWGRDVFWSKTHNKRANR
jgi:hypothetical protein